jgi:hypothetical protein
MTNSDESWYPLPDVRGRAEGVSQLAPQPDHRGCRIEISSANTPIGKAAAVRK